MATDILDVLRTKRDGGRLSSEQIQFFIDGYTEGSVADEQAAALCSLWALNGVDSASWHNDDVTAHQHYVRLQFIAVLHGRVLERDRLLLAAGFTTQNHHLVL